MIMIGDSKLNDKCRSIYGKTPMAGTEQHLTDMNSDRAATVLQCLALTENNISSLPSKTLTEPALYKTQHTIPLPDEARDQRNAEPLPLATFQMCPVLTLLFPD